MKYFIEDKQMQITEHLTRRDFVKAVGLGAAAIATAGCQQGASRTSGRAVGDRPNFVIIFTDDQGYEDVGCFGSPLIRTPNLDRMAAEGMKFTDFYVASAICSPSRAALMTGCYPPRVGITRVLFPRDKGGLDPEETTIADVLKTRGYATACIGKWHLGHLPQFLPTRQGFDYYFGIPYSNDMRYGEGDPTLADKYRGGDVPLMRNEEIIELPANQETITKRYTAEAVNFIAKNKDKPFLLYLPHTMPHIPLHASEQFRAKSRRVLYGDVIEEIDFGVGRILAALKEHGLDENTLVIFTSDNGPWLSKALHGGSALPLRGGKFTTFEGGMRVPCIMRWPAKIPAGSVCSEPCATIDILPTLAQLAGVALPQDRIIDGKDIWALMTGAPGSKSPREAFYYYKGERLEAVRCGKLKLALQKT